MNNEEAMEELNNFADEKALLRMAHTHKKWHNMQEALKDKEKIVLHKILKVLCGKRYHNHRQSQKIRKE